MVTWRDIDAAAPWYGGGAIVKLRGVVIADWPGTPSNAWLPFGFSPSTNFLGLDFYVGDPGDVWASDFTPDAGTYRLGLGVPVGGDYFYSVLHPGDPTSLPALTAGDEVYLVAEQFGPSWPTPPTPEEWDPLTDFGSFWDGEGGTGTNIGPPWLTLIEITPPTPPTVYYGPWTVPDPAYVGTATPTGNMTRYSGSGSTVALAADSPDLSTEIRKGLLDLALAGATASTRTFQEGIILGDARTEASGDAPGTGPTPPDATAIDVEWESGAGEWTGYCRFHFDLDVTALGDASEETGPAYTGWYGDDIAFQVRLSPEWTVGTDDLGAADTVLFPDGWRSAADLSAMTLLRELPLDLDSASSREFGPVKTDIVPLDIGDARLAAAVTLDAQLDHVDIGSPPAGYGRGLMVTIVAADLELQYQPPRFRFVYAARPPLAHRQRRDGVATAGPPLGHRQGADGAARPPLAHRQRTP